MAKRKRENVIPKGQSYQPKEKGKDNEFWCETQPIKNCKCCK